MLYYIQNMLAFICIKWYNYAVLWDVIDINLEEQKMHRCPDCGERFEGNICTFCGKPVPQEELEQEKAVQEKSDEQANINNSEEASKFTVENTALNSAGVQPVNEYAQNGYNTQPVNNYAQKITIHSIVTETLITTTAQCRAVILIKISRFRML